ncbi:probable cytochrome P450 305a1 [Cephus cinctus]|uniref:Cytochrome P450-1 n=1 Tax=Cephus cinctus TaxID=211228 RepID=A0A1W6L1I0_CEPCN|nr:probable cytochrome P450 305a1 [Cephus cinctus]ARN17924.1 cytochrome P450-1 [Cephus cinctus]
MFTDILLAIVVLLFVACILSGGKSKNYPPGPYSWPLVGNIYQLRKLACTHGGQHLALLELSRRYSSDVIALRLGRQNMIAVSGYEGIQTILNGQEYEGRPWNEFIKIRNMGMRKGITMSDGPEWKEIRAWVVRSLRSVGFGRREMSVMIKDEVVHVVENLKVGGVRSMKPVIAPAVINVLWTMATGKRLCEGPRLQYFMELMERRAKAFDMSGGILSTFPWMRYLAPEFSGYNVLMVFNEEIKNFLMDIINEHKENYTPGNEDDLIDMFLGEMYSGKGAKAGFTEDQLVMILMDLFIAGITTTTVTLDFLFLNMVMHVDKQKRLQQEVDAIVGRERLPELSDRPNLPYTEAVLTESQRICMVTPVIGPRRVLSDTELLGYTIPENTTVLINVYSVHMDPLHYPEPEKFKPERFIKDGVYVPDENLMLFGRGRRRCPGEALARSALFLLFVGILQKFVLLPVPGKQTPTLDIVPGLTISPKPYEVLVVPRDNCTNGTSKLID